MEYVQNNQEKTNTDDILSRKCNVCEKNLRHSDKWDSRYCEYCNEWKEPKCKCDNEIKCPGK